MYGTQESLNRINEYQGPTVDLSKIDSSGTYTYEIPLQGTIKEIAPQQASMKVEVVSAVTKEFQDIPIHVEGKGEDTEVVFVSPGNGTFDLMLEGAPEKLDALKPEDLRAYINIEDYSNGTYGLPLSVDLPPHIHISRDLPVVNVVIQSPSG